MFPDPIYKTVPFNKARAPDYVYANNFYKLTFKWKFPTWRKRTQGGIPPPQALG